MTYRSNPRSGVPWRQDHYTADDGMPDGVVGDATGGAFARTVGSGDVSTVAAGVYRKKGCRFRLEIPQTITTTSSGSAQTWLTAIKFDPRPAAVGDPITLVHGLKAAVEALAVDGVEIDPIEEFTRPGSGAVPAPTVASDRRVWVGDNVRARSLTHIRSTVSLGTVAVVDGGQAWATSGVAANTVERFLRTLNNNIPVWQSLDSPPAGPLDPVGAIETDTDSGQYELLPRYQLLPGWTRIHFRVKRTSGAFTGGGSGTNWDLLDIPNPLARPGGKRELLATSQGMAAPSVKVIVRASGLIQAVIGAGDSRSFVEFAGSFPR